MRYIYDTVVIDGSKKMPGQLRIKGQLGLMLHDSLHDRLLSIGVGRGQHRAPPGREATAIEDEKITAEIEQTNRMW